MTSHSNGHRPDDLTRQQVRDRLNENLYLEAGAGTGKTNALVTRLSELLISGTAEPAQVAAITFTRAAAFEMRYRLRSALEERVSAEQDLAKRDRIATVIDGLDAVTIQTIHSFALSLLREQPLAIGLPPVIEPVDDIQATVEFDGIWSEWFTEQIEADPDLAPALGVAARLGIRNPSDHLKQLARKLGEVHQLLQPDTFAYRGSPPAAIPTARLKDVLDESQRLLAFAPDPTDTMRRFVNEQVVPEIAALLALAGDSSEVPASDFAEWPELKLRGKGNKANWRKVDGGEEALERLRELLGQLQQEIDESLAPLRQQTLSTLLTSVTDFVLTYAESRRDQGRLTFHDQLVLANRLLNGNAEARDRLPNRFRFILVDEFQDTDPLQIELLRQLAGTESGRLRPGSLFIVGDPKQSIYRFRGADPASSSGFSAEVAESGAELPLSENHRSMPGILRWVNTVFSGWMKEGESGGQAPHRNLGWDDSLQEAEAQAEGVPVRWFGGEVAASAPDARRLEFEQISEIANAAGEGTFKVRGEDGELRASTFADVAILVRRRTGIDALEDALIEKSIPYVLDTQAPLFKSQDIRDLHACLTAIDDPSDQVAILAAVRSPAFSCPDTDLLRWKRSGGRFAHLDENQPGEPESVAAALTELHRYHALSREMDTAALVETFIRERRLREKSLLTHIGPERARRLDLVVELANALSDPDSGSAITLRHFTRWIALQADENAQMPERLSQGAVNDAVRIMTVHGAKGLEFPIVVMASAQGGQNNTDSVQLRIRRAEAADSAETQHLEVQLGSRDIGLKTSGADDALAQEAEEGDLEDVRLLYVAATRARDHLFVSRYRGKSAKRALVGKIEQHLEGNEQLWQEWSYPGRTQPAPSTGRTSPDKQAQRDRWAVDQAKLIERASRRGYTTPTALKPESASALQFQPKEPSSTVEDDPAKPGRAATDLGRAVHAVLQHIDLTVWSDEELSALAEQMAAEHNLADSGEVESLSRAALETETMASASAAARRGQAWREVRVAAPFPMNAGDLEGQIDLMFLEDDGSLTLVDHKTDTDRGDSISQAAEPYLPQMGAYAWCAEKVSGLTVSRATLIFASRALAGGESEHEVPDLEQEKERAAKQAAEQLSSSANAS